MARQQLQMNFDALMMRRHIEVVHEGDDGYIALCSASDEGVFNQRHYLLDELLCELDCMQVDGGKNYYFSVNSFYRPQRTLENVRQLRALYADVDFHHLPPGGAKRRVDDTLKFLEWAYAEHELPAPSIVVKTGRGIQLYWLIEDLPKQGVPLWKLVQDALTGRLREVTEPLDLHVDNVSDVSRILRLGGTRNTKARKMATLQVRSHNKYRLDKLIEAYFPELEIISHGAQPFQTRGATIQAKPAQRVKRSAATNGAEHTRQAKPAEHKKQAEPVDGKPVRSTANTRSVRGATNRAKAVYLYNLYSLHYARLCDLVKLLELRKGEVAGDECRRRMVFLYRYWGCCYLHDPHRALEDTLRFNENFTTPLPRPAVEAATLSAEKAYFDWLSGTTVNIGGNFYRRGYNYKNETLIDMLGVTADEQREMATIIGKEEKYRRNNARRTGRDETGLTQKQRETKAAAQAVQALRAQGKKQKEIAELLGLSLSKVKHLSVKRVQN